MAKQKDIFRTLKSYSHGFHTIADEFAKHQAKMYRSQMQGQYAELICNAEWKAIDNTLMALIDSKPLKKD